MNLIEINMVRVTAGEWKHHASRPVVRLSRVCTFLPFLRRLKDGKAHAKNPRREEQIRGADWGRTSTNLGQPDICGHDLLPLVLQEEEKLLRRPPGLQARPSHPRRSFPYLPEPGAPER